MHLPFESVTFGNSLSLRVDGAIGAMSLLPNGRDAVLAGRKGLFIIDLDDPFTTPRWLHHDTMWEVADVQWSPHHQAKPSWCISTSNQKALLWDLARPSNNAVATVLHQHTRAITDINFHPFNPELLATCSIDTFVLAWDMRSPRKAVSKWAEWRAGATQVKWNHKNPYEIASSHDNNLAIWDLRKGALPVARINKAHRGKINGVDFSNGIDNIITCSNDKTICCWDLLNSDDEPKPTVVIETEFPVARARTLPFGSDKACGVMPLRGGNNTIQIVNYDAAYHAAKTRGTTHTIKATSAYSFKGHNAPIKDFLWRRRHERYANVDPLPHKDYQLVSWLSQEYDLKLWPHDDELYHSVNYAPSHQNILPDPGDLEEEHAHPVFSYTTYCTEPPVTIDDLEKSYGDTLSLIAKFQLSKKHKSANPQWNHLDWISGVRIGHLASGRDDVDDDGPTNLGEEVSIVGHKFPKIRFEKISVSTGNLVISLKGPVPVEEPVLSTISEGSEKRDSKADTNVSEDDANTSTAIHDDEHRLVFIRMEVKFPPTYPYPDEKYTPIKFDIEETHEISSTIKEEMLRNLHEIAAFYTDKYHRFCLEPCLRYLLGDKLDLSDELMVEADGDAEVEVGDENWADDLIRQQPDYPEDLLEDEDADLIPAISDSQWTPIHPTTTNEEKPVFSPDNAAYDSTPLPKGCGAIWLPTGQLVCFFISPNEETKLSAIDKALLDLDQSTDNSDVSDVESVSSDESFTNDWDDILQDDIPSHTRIPGLFKTAVGLGNHYTSSHNRLSLNRVTSNGGSAYRLSAHGDIRKKPRKHKVKNVINVLDFSHLQPDKFELACEYRVLGDSPENLARYNSEVALRYGLTEISDVWKILETILLKDYRANDALDFYDQGPRRFYWGQHPFGHMWLIREIFSYFELRGNVQMLAMLSCVLHENKMNFSDDCESLRVPANTPYRALPPPPSALRIRETDESLPSRLNSHQSSFSKKEFSGLQLVASLAELPFSERMLKKPDFNKSFRSKQRPRQQALRKQRKPPAVHVQMLNTDTLDLYEDKHTSSLLDSQDHAKIKLYREQYAEMLFLWGLPINRIKILKFNYPDEVRAHDFGTHEFMFGLHQVSGKSSALVPETTVSLARTTVWATANPLKYCALCELVVTKRVCVCMRCDHVLHAECAVEWWTHDDDECPSGCGCVCQRYNL